MKIKTIFDKHSRNTNDFEDFDYETGISEELKRKELNIPDLNEVDVVRHYTELSKKNYGVDDGFYPLGSCTMKYNPKINEEMAKLPGFANIHPYLPEEHCQGALQLMYELEKDLCEVTGMNRMSLQPAAGAHGELTGIMLIKAYHNDNGQLERNKIITPDSSHGTNPASVASCGFWVVEIKSDSNGGVDLDQLQEAVGKDTAGIMLTNPNTLGLFDRNIKEINRIVHDAGGLTYCDGANMNAIMGKAKPAEMGFDIMHLNLHKSFSTPHGCGGPGSGPVGVVENVAPYLPVPLVEKNETGYYLDYSREKTIGRVRAFYGNFGVLVKAYTYIKSLGSNGLKEASETAVLNANYIMTKLKDHYDLPYDKVCQHECVFSGARQLEKGVHTMDIAKRLIDYGFHPPTIYFPLIVKEAIMIEPTETESKQTLDDFIDAMIKIARESEENPEIVKGAPHTINTPVSRLDGVEAARNPILTCSCV